MDSLYHKFKILHAELQALLGEQSFEEEVVQKKITKYISYMIQDKSDEQQKIFDHFCEFNGIEIFHKLMKGDPLLAIKSYSLLFINLKNEMWISYILCQPFLMEAITLKCDSKDQEYTEYFVSFLKSLSIRINSSQIALFYNKKNCNFPLAMAAMKYFNHSDFMVRTSVMNIVLQLMKIQQQKSKQYFSRFPFTSYIINFACEVNQLITNYHNNIRQSELHSKQLTNYKVDVSDYFYYFNDLIQFGTPKAVEVIQQCIISYIIIPIFNWLLEENENSQIHAMLLINQSLKIFKSKKIVAIITALLFKPTVCQQLINQIKQFTNAYQPEVFRKPFSSHNNYWDDYQNQITIHCLQVFKQIQKFEVESEGNIRQQNPRFKQEMGRISHFIHYDLLKCIKIDQTFDHQLFHSQQIQITNPFQTLFISKFIDAPHNNFIVSSHILLQLFYNPIIQEFTNAMQVGHEQVVYPIHIDEQLRLKIKEYLMRSIQSISFECLAIKKIANIFNLLRYLIEEAQDIQFQQNLLKNYRTIVQHLKEYTTIQNMNFIVQNFTKYYNLLAQTMSKNVYESSIPYYIGLLTQQKWQQRNIQYIIPTKQNQIIVHFIYHFFIFRSFLTHYFIKFYQAQYEDFEELYSKTFYQTIKKWKIGNEYKITNKSLVGCLVQGKQQKKNKKGMIVQDQFSFVLIESAQKYCKILANQSWKNTNFQINKEDGTWLDATIRTKDNIDKYRLIFQDQISSNTALVRLNDLKWQSYQYELSFIKKFLAMASQQ